MNVWKNHIVFRKNDRNFWKTDCDELVLTLPLIEPSYRPNCRGIELFRTFYHFIRISAFFKGFCSIVLPLQLDTSEYNKPLVSNILDFWKILLSN